MSKRGFSIFLTLALGLLGFAISPWVPGPVTPCRADEPVSGKISFMMQGDPADEKAYEGLIAEFSKKYPGVEVTLVYCPNQLVFHQKLSIDFAAATPNDVFLINYRRYALFVSSGALEPLDAWVAGSKSLALDDFYSEAVDAFRWNGALYAIPQNISSLAVYYNKSLFDAAGVPYPKADWTWSDFVRTARKLTRDTNGDGTTDQYGLGSEAVIFRVAPFIWQNGGDIVDDPRVPKKLALDSKASRSALEWFVDLQVKHKVVPSLVEEKAEPSASRFLHGTTAMYFDSRRGVPTYRNITDFDWDAAPLPRGKTSANILHSDGFFMAALCRNKPAAWAFIEFASSAEGQTFLAHTGRTVPSRKAIANSPVFLDPGQKPKNSQVFLDVIPHLRSVPILPYWPDIEHQTGQEIEQAYHGALPLDEAIRRATERTSEFFRMK